MSFRFVKICIYKNGNNSIKPNYFATPKYYDILNKYANTILCKKFL